MEMAHTFWSPVIGKLVELLSEEVKSLKGVHREVKSLKEELEIIQPLLEYAEAKSEKSQMRDFVKPWLKQIRTQADRIEDVIDAYRYHLQKARSQSGFIASLHKLGHPIEALKCRHEIACEIESIKQSLSDIKSRAQGYGLSVTSISTTHESRIDLRMEALFVDKDEFVEVNCTSEELIQNLLKGQPTRAVIALVGQGGIGKTTLARKAFGNDYVSRHFESACAWITVSRPYSLKKVLKMMKEKICFTGFRDVGELADTNEDIIDYLRKYLDTKRYMIVFDDVWKERFWEDIKFALPNNNKGSRILLTTRKQKVANSCRETPYDLIIMRLESWSQALAWELFCKKAFRFEFEGICPKELEKLSMKIVEKCGGLPLVIAGIASLLATKEKEVFEWERLLNDLDSKLKTSNSHFKRVQEILSLSYYDLPSMVRFCFLYFGIFSKNTSISDERLYRLWIAEGFIKAEGDKTLEEVAREHLNELIQRNLVLVDPWTWIGEGNFFRVHDLIHDIILSKANELHFFQIQSKKDSRSSSTELGRRLSIFDSSSAEFALKNAKSSRIRSLFLSSVDREPTNEASLLALLKKFKLLQVFDIQNAPIETLPKELGNLFLLKYLSLKNTNVKALPKSISKLHHLQSLDIRDTLIRELPKEVNKLKNMRHILAYNYMHDYVENSFSFVEGVTIHKGFGDLKALQTLTAVDANLGGVSLMKEFKNLINLRWLAILKITKESCEDLCTSIEKMPYLERLCLCSIDENEVLALHHISSPPQFLRDLVLIGKLEKVPDWIPKLGNLSGLTLYSSKLTNDPIKTLKGLPNLETLYLGGEVYLGEELHFKDRGFVKLKKLLLCKLEKLKAVKIDLGAMPFLEQLHIDDCLLLKEVPLFQNLSNINFVKVNGKRLR